MTARPVALVVGAGDYIGSAIAKRFAAGGFTVAAGRRNAEKLEPLVKEIEAAGGRARGLAFDARDEENVQAAFATPSAATSETPATPTAARTDAIFFMVLPFPSSCGEAVCAPPA